MPGPEAASRRGALLAVERADSSSDRHDPPSRRSLGAGGIHCQPRISTGVKPATTGLTASAPATSGVGRSTVSIVKRALTFGVTSTVPTSVAW